MSRKRPRQDEDEIRHADEEDGVANSSDQDTNQQERIEKSESLEVQTKKEEEQKGSPETTELYQENNNEDILSKKPNNPDDLTDWQAVWDTNTGKYYFWSPSTNKTQWTNPYESTLTSEDPSTTDFQPDYTFTAQFNARTGRFTSETSGPGKVSEFNRAKRQMDFYFDYENFAKERAEEIMNPTPKPRPTKAQVEYYKKRQKEKKEMKKKAWLIND